MTDPGRNRNEDHGSGRPGWLPDGLLWDLGLILLGFMGGLAICFWLFTRLGWW